MSLQGVPSGCALPFIDFKTKVQPHYSPLILSTIKLKSTKGSAQPDGTPCRSLPIAMEPQNIPINFILTTHLRPVKVLCSEKF